MQLIPRELHWPLFNLFTVHHLLRICQLLLLIVNQQSKHTLKLSVADAFSEPATYQNTSHEPPRKNMKIYCRRSVIGQNLSLVQK